jgi:hypothetical protein
VILAGDTGIQYALEELNPNTLIFGGTPGNRLHLQGRIHSANPDRSNEFDPAGLPHFVAAQRGEVLAMTRN